jgi:hypothetical protein
MKISNKHEKNYNKEIWPMFNSIIILIMTLNILYCTNIFNAQQKLALTTSITSPLSKRKISLYLNKKYQQLIPAIKKNLQNMKGDDTYDRIFKKRLESYLEKKTR